MGARARREGARGPAAALLPGAGRRPAFRGTAEGSPRRTQADLARVIHRNPRGRFNVRMIHAEPQSHRDSSRSGNAVPLAMKRMAPSAPIDERAGDDQAEY